MGSTLRTLALIAGLALMYNGYQAGKAPDPNPVPTPDNPDPAPQPVPGGTLKIISDVDNPPPAPTNPQVAAASAPIRQLLQGNAMDALKLSRTFTGWSELIAGSQSLKTTADMQKILQDAMTMLLARHRMAGKYALTQPIDATITAAFASVGLTDGGTLASAPWTPAAAGAAKQAFDAIAYQCFQAFIDATRKPAAASIPMFHSEGSQYDFQSRSDYLWRGWRRSIDAGRLVQALC